ncbi:hypothetical protein CAI21_17210 [Alkalilimnicola ehrlichii]|uniref:Biopolymer transporter ExbD n=1 Tax=Alkalilimnicola ehrlichii TaxID=351052 RepID=A0A3E0WMK8_9GAMM|nr:biopolymer transporter ExbD [Alkalilimnicola ehrlichii]RFA26222.1 hypothetical protein CAI21_17210 [Alkalilimnicola ehrlichii]RFA33206.1 hypothetical protein CAL65_17690 [Alkalilimnicola ehrlichii]
MSKARLRRHRRLKETPELEVTTFLNLMVVLIPFLLVTAIFSRITIQELTIPEGAAGGNQPDQPVVTIEVIIRDAGLEIGDGRRVVTSFPKQNGSHDLARLSEYLQGMKSRYADKEDATILVEPDVPYEDLIHVMDTVKVAEVVGEDGEEREIISLFPQLSLGEAP